MTNDRAHVRGVGRIADSERELLVYFGRRPTDDEMRDFHEALKALSAPLSPRPDLAGLVESPSAKRLAAEFYDGFTPGNRQTPVDVLAEAFQWLQSRSVAPSPESHQAAIEAAAKALEGRAYKYRLTASNANYDNVRAQECLDSAAAIRAPRLPADPPAQPEMPIEPEIIGTNPEMRKRLERMGRGESPEKEESDA